MSLASYQCSTPRRCFMPRSGVEPETLAVSVRCSSATELPRRGDRRDSNPQRPVPQTGALRLNLQQIKIQLLSYGHSTPSEIRTRVVGLRGRYPGPLDDGGIRALFARAARRLAVTFELSRRAYELVRLNSQGGRKIAVEPRYAVVNNQPQENEKARSFSLRAFADR